MKVEKFEDKYPERPIKLQYAIKASISSVVVVILLLVCTFPSLMPMDKVLCIEDNVLRWTGAANKFFTDNVFIKKSIMIILGIFVDLLVLTQFYLWTFKGKSWRYAIAISAVYGLNLILTSMFKMPYPDGYIWEFPGFFSITMHYGSGNTFYFCPYIGLLLINFFEFK